MFGRLRRWWSEMTDFLDPWDAELDADEAELARLRARLNVRTIAMHESDCPLGNCTTCQTAAVAEATTPICQPPTHIGRSGDFKTRVLQVSDWLLTALPEHWCSTDDVYLCRVAAWLIDLREQVENGRWKV